MPRGEGEQARRRRPSDLCMVWESLTPTLILTLSLTLTLPLTLTLALPLTIALP